MNPKKEFDFFDKAHNQKLLWVLLYAVCAILLVFDFFIHRDAHFSIDGFWGFYPMLGFIACAVLILFSKVVGFILKVKEDYYD